MKVLFDATWIARYYNQNLMLGCLRVTYELAKRLVDSKLCETHLTTTIYSEMGYKPNLERFLREVCGAKENRLALNYPPILKIDDELRKLVRTNRGRGFLLRRFSNGNESFINNDLLSKFNIYHSPAEAIPEIIKKNRRIRPFLTSLDLTPFVWPEVASDGYGYYLKEIYDSVDERTVVLAISESTRNDLLNYRKDIDPENVVVTYIAADKTVFFPNKDKTEFQKLKEKYKIKYNDYFLMLNRLQKHKNTEHTLKCFDEAVRSGELKDTGIVVIGTFYDDKEVRVILEKYGKSPHIQFIEYVEDGDLSVLYSNAICFLYMSLYEGFGLPILEVMHCGTPVICSNTSSMPEVIGDCGITVDPQDAEGLCDAIVKMANNEELRTKSSQKGLERSKLFSWDQYTNDVVNAYQRFQYAD